MIFKEEIDESAIKYIKEVKKNGGVLSYGSDNVKHLIRTEQTLLNGFYNNEPNEWEEGKKKAWESKLMENIEVGDGCYFKVKISKKGLDVLSQFQSNYLLTNR